MRTAATLIVGPSWVGDMVMAQSLFRVLNQREPDRAFDVLAPEWSLPIVARMPEIRNGIASETAHGEIGLRKRRRIAATLRDTGYERAIVLPRSFKSALIPWFARIPSALAIAASRATGSSMTYDRSIARCSIRP